MGATRRRGPELKSGQRAVQPAKRTTSPAAVPVVLRKKKTQFDTHPLRCAGCASPAVTVRVAKSCDPSRDYSRSRA
eukprot:3537049-Rhodomonas_salina.1